MWPLAFPVSRAKLHRAGAVAQSGERVVRNDEVRGSIPLGSTNPKNSNHLLLHNLFLSLAPGVIPLRTQPLTCVKAKRIKVE